MPEERCLVPQPTVEENIQPPLWVAKHLDRKVRLDFVYEVIGELTDMRDRQGAAGKRRPAKTGRTRPCARHRHQIPVAQSTVRGHSAVVAERLSEVLGSLKGRTCPLDNRLCATRPQASESALTMPGQE
jgi:branched-chain amino acid transport system ATP-binding protein